MKGLVVVFLVVILLFTVISDGKGQFHIKSLDIKFDKTDATFTAHYDLSGFPKLYVLLLGSKNIGPEIKTIFINFNYKIVKMDEDKAILKVRNISRQDKGYYLHEPIKFGGTIDKVDIYSPDSAIPREYLNINSTPPFFYRAIEDNG